MMDESLVFFFRGGVVPLFWGGQPASAPPCIFCEQRPPTMYAERPLLGMPCNSRGGVSLYNFPLASPFSLSAPFARPVPSLLFLPLAPALPAPQEGGREQRGVEVDVLGRAASLSPTLYILRAKTSNDVRRAFIA